MKVIDLVYFSLWTRHLFKIQNRRFLYQGTEFIAYRTTGRGVSQSNRSLLLYRLKGDGRMASLSLPFGRHKIDPIFEILP